MYDDFIDYGQLIDDAMHVIVKKALERVVKDGLPGKHHFFISFLTTYPGVSISDALKKKYPEEMTIVLQHQFEGLDVTDIGFSVTLSFDNVKERITIPFDSLAAFADPSVKFGLQFRHADDFEDGFDGEDEFSADVKEFEPSSERELMNKKSPIAKKGASANTKEKPKGKKTGKKGGKSAKGDTNVVSLDTFRKK